MKKSFTIVEILIVLVVVGLISALGLIAYGKTISKAADGEAKSTLSLIQVAQRSYRMEHSGYYCVSGIANINLNLRLSLPTNSQWTFTPDCSTPGSEFATATRSGRVWRIDFPRKLPALTYENPTCIANCS